MSLSRLARLFSAPLTAVALIVLPVVLASCTLKSGGFIIANPAHIRVFNALINGGPVTLTLGSDTIVSQLPFEGIAGYQDVIAGTQELKVIAGPSTIYDLPTLLIDDVSYSYLVFGTTASPTVLQVNDTVTNTPGSGVFNLRVINAAFANTGFDVYVTAPGAPLANMSPNFSGVSYQNISNFAVINAGSYQLRVTPSNSKQVVYDSGTLTFGEATSYQFVVYTRGSGTLLNGALLTIDNAGNGNIVNSLLAQFKMVHAAPGTAAVNAFVDSTLAFANLPYLGATSYQVFSATTHTITAQPVATPGAVIASTQQALASATDSSIVLTGTPGATGMLVLADSNLPGTAGSARIRYVNVAPGLGPVDIYVNFALNVPGLATNVATSYLELTENTYSITFNAAGTTTLVLSLPSVALLANDTYTLYLTGTSGAYTGILTIDGLVPVAPTP